ncbi:SCP2 sterol-binding domain-containing protein [Bhargavaea cecembensis]|uniref:SCP2 sterol-binding domain-containing protein n=1 Tax=Bhargavaea cecembensis TaxID=394098 RepID=UPI00058BABA5|nr:SCP2 sterol-binding domain-containing protein [Bhargavaea cecembensis]
MGNPLDGLSLDEIWALIKEKLDANPEPFKDQDVRYEFFVEGKDEHGRWQLLLDHGKADVLEGSPEEAACTLELGGKHFRKLLTGDLNSMAAFMTGKLKVKGNVGFALKLEQLLKEYDFSG